MLQGIEKRKQEGNLILYAVLCAVKRLLCGSYCARIIPIAFYSAPAYYSMLMCTYCNSVWYAQESQVGAPPSAPNIQLSLNIPK